MKDPHEINIKLIKQLSSLMKEQKISVLEYQLSDLKLKIKKFNEQYIKVDTSNDIIGKQNQLESFQEKEDTSLAKNTYSKDSQGAIKSPMVGTAYISPEPGKPPFIKIGDIISKDQPLVIIEAMKVMNTINSEKSGKVTYIGFEDGQPVEFDQLLVIIE